MRSCLFYLLSIGFAGCQQPEPAVPVQSQFKKGEELYSLYCTSCHEVDLGIGPKLSKDVVATRVNAQLLFNYNKRNMPYEAGNSLTEQQYWDITAYLTVRDGFMDSTVVLSVDNAGSINLVIPSK